ncbi:Phosphoserine phosphatase RsbU [Candidatus Methylobacter favarea]|uniref:Phosphoserine phosphatase RsbU n=1 Tax=Candidatus Methylobacter favarea TaxID=2707345 RepID=A0A8S0W8M7_9GAMM|nr:PAS domain S-box protein [Candidatus Methylobacter favarea]CAA9889384.1 Phosphoserine phosphatase RsbU [Candidatus Methylobacter favarea]
MAIPAYSLLENLAFNFIIFELDYSTHPSRISAVIKHVNRSATTLLGYSEKELVEKPLAVIFAPENETQQWQTAIKNLAAENLSKSFKGKIVTKANKEIQAVLSFSLLPGEKPEKTVILLIQKLEVKKPQDKDVFIMHRAVEQSASAVIITDLNGRIEYLNPKFTELTGYTAAELIGQSAGILHPDDRYKEHYHAMREMLFSWGEWRGEIKNRKKNGEVYWSHECISAIKNDQGEITHFLTVEEDITRKKQVESALSESEERFRQMAEMTGEWLWEQDPDGYYTYSSTAVNQILGFKQEEVIGKHYTEFLTAQDKVDQQSYVGNRQPFYALINHYHHKDGHEVLTESTGLPIIGADGKLLKWRGVDRDITAKKHFQDALIDSEKRTRLIIESSLSAIVIMNSFGIIIDWNHHSEKMFGWLRMEAIGQHLEELIIPMRFRSAHRQGLKEFLHSGKGPFLNRQIEHVALRRDGSEFPVEFSVSPLKLGNAYIFSGFIHDITARKAAERQIRQAQVNLAIAQSEIKIAHQIQASLLPSAPIKSEHFEITGFCLPAHQVGGDYFDYFFRNKDYLDMVIADVSGHSVGPALFMVEARSAIRTQASGTWTPSETLKIINNFLFRDLNKADFFITLFYLQYDLTTHQLSFANAGHPPPLLLRSLQSECTQLDADGLILGIRENVVFEEKKTSLSQGDLILFYTDGLTEAENVQGEFFGIKRVSEIFIRYAHQGPQAIIDALLEQLKQFCQSESFKDDVTLMIFKRR